MNKFWRETFKDPYFYTSIVWIAGFIFIGVLVWNLALACDSYEDCMEERPVRSWVECYDKNCATNDCPEGKDCYRTNPCKECEELRPKSPDYLKAIAYKMDEISKKLDKPKIIDTRFSHGDYEEAVKSK